MIESHKIRVTQLLYEPFAKLCGSTLFMVRGEMASPNPIDAETIARELEGLEDAAAVEVELDSTC